MGRRNAAARLRTAAAHWVLPLLALACVRSAVASPFHVPTGSMVPAIEVGDRILVSKLSYGLNVPWLSTSSGLGPGIFTTVEAVRWAEPRRGDVVLFRYPPDPSIDYVKRVVGIPGDRVEVVDGVVVVNGASVVLEPAGLHDFVDQHCQSWPTLRFDEVIDGVRHPVLDSIRRQGPDQPPVVVPDGHLFVLGDNRDHSADSRAWGMVPRDLVRGRAVGVWMSHGCDGSGTIGWRRL